MFGGMELLDILDNILKSEKRPNWEQYFLMLSILAARRSTCLRRHVGAVIVKEKNVLSTGYNGAARGAPHCSVTGCIREKMNVPSGEKHELCTGLHAEQNAILQAAYHGVSIRGSDIYATTRPCVICTKMIINAGIKRIFFLNDYNDPLAAEILNTVDVELYKLNEQGKPTLLIGAK
jgi:dCMP deaminase